MNDGIIRKLDADSYKGRRFISEEMSYNTKQLDTVWTKRLIESQLELNDDSGQVRHFHNTEKNLTGGRKFHAVMKNDAGDQATMRATWQKEYDSQIRLQSDSVVETNWPHIEMGWVSLSLVEPGLEHLFLGEGTLQSPNPFYTSSGRNVVDEAAMSGEWSAMAITGEQRSGEWTLKLGGTNIWSLDDISDI